MASGGMDAPGEMARDGRGRRAMDRVEWRRCVARCVEMHRIGLDYGLR